MRGLDSLLVGIIIAPDNGALSLFRTGWNGFGFSGAAGPDERLNLLPAETKK
jgi:hypothetical protein